MFKFRLQRILELRQKREQALAVQLADARGNEERARQAAEALERERDAGAQRAAAAQGQRATVGQLQNLRMVVDRMSEQVQAAHQQVATASQQVEQCMAEFTVAFQERRVMDRLRERDLSNWRAQETQSDRQLMDAIALGRFVRRPARDQGQETEE